VARSAKVARDWQQACNQLAGECQRVYDQLAADPTYDDGDRQHPLDGAAGRGSFEGVSMRRWQIDVTAGGRIWYFVDEQPTGTGQKRRSGRVILDAVHTGHPKVTETKPTAKRRLGRR
jgi:hypothetical protein